MVGELMIFPVRAGVRVTRFAVRAGLSVSARALTIALGVVKPGGSDHDDWQPPAPSTETRPARERAGARESAGTDNGNDPRSAATVLDEAPAHRPEPPEPPEPPAVISREPTPLTDEPGPLTEEPAHVSEEPTLVEERAEPGAEDGAGAQVRIDEPWEGYAQMNAKDVTSHLAVADAAELAAVQLYESAHKQRETVLSAVQRELRSRSTES